MFFLSYQVEISLENLDLDRNIQSEKKLMTMK